MGAPRLSQWFGLGQDRKRRFLISDERRNICAPCSEHAGGVGISPHAFLLRSLLRGLCRLDGTCGGVLPSCQSEGDALQTRAAHF
jgi:hypothetical protein